MKNEDWLKGFQIIDCRKTALLLNGDEHWIITVRPKDEDESPKSTPSKQEPDALQVQR